MSGMRLAQGLAGLIRGNAQGAADLRPTVAFRHFSPVFAPPSPLLRAAFGAWDRCTMLRKSVWCWCGCDVFVQWRPLHPSEWGRAKKLRHQAFGLDRYLSLPFCAAMSLRHRLRGQIDRRSPDLCDAFLEKVTKFQTMPETLIIKSPASVCARPDRRTPPRSVRLSRPG